VTGAAAAQRPQHGEGDQAEAEQAGADAVSCINTLLGLAIDVETRRPRLGFGTGGLSGPAIRPVAVRMAWQAARAVRIPVIGIGGIASTSDVLEFLIPGCRAVQIGTANFVDPGIYPRILAGLSEYLERHGLADINDVVGTLEYPDLPRPCEESCR
jgi:dihydroorotate dehydrogenase (NAD+) catalytic subunit